jgi:hypothetical protein
MKTVEVELDIPQGGKFEYTLLVKNNGVIQNLTGWSAKLQIREARDESLPVLAAWTSAGGQITFNAVAGLVLIDVTGTLTAAYTWERGAYDLVLTDGSGAPYRAMQGNVRVSRRVTV